jgi:RHO1 GDP-GTP exchange protein 1/2
MISVVPNFGGATTSTQMAELKTRCEEAKPLGLIRTESGEIMVIYDSKSLCIISHSTVFDCTTALGCYITKHGAPSRKSGFIRWEAKVTSFAHRGSHVLLFSSEFIEIWHLSTGRLDQVIEGSDIRLLLHANVKSNSSDDTLLVAMRGTKDDKDGVSDKIMELVQTSEIGAMQTPMTGTRWRVCGMSGTCEILTYERKMKNQWAYST